MTGVKPMTAMYKQPTKNNRLFSEFNESSLQVKIDAVYYIIVMRVLSK